MVKAATIDRMTRIILDHSWSRKRNTHKFLWLTLVQVAIAAFLLQVGDWAHFVLPIPLLLGGGYLYGFLRRMLNSTRVELDEQSSILTITDGPVPARHRISMPLDEIVKAKTERYHSAHWFRSRTTQENDRIVYRVVLETRSGEPVLLLDELSDRHDAEATALSIARLAGTAHNFIDVAGPSIELTQP